MWLVLLIAGAVLVAAAAARVAQSSGPAGNDSTFVFRERAGPYHYWGKRRGGRAFQAAVTAFGRPSARGKSEPTSRICTIRWESRGIDVDFIRAAGCGDRALRRDGYWIGMRLWGIEWKTQRGLRVGDPVRKIRELYPDARYVSRPPNAAYWELLARQSKDFGRIPLLEAHIGAGRVTAIDVPPGFIF